MQFAFIWILALVWLAMTFIYIYRQAHYYQIEEYMSLRYVRWLFSLLERWIPVRAVVVAFLGLILAFFTDSIPGETSFPPYVISILAAIFAGYPIAPKEVKKAFVRTQRATRILAAAFIWASLVVVGIVAARAMLPIPESDRFLAGYIALVGLLSYLLAPLWLILGNITMMPVEGFLRRQFVKRAEEVLATVRPKIIGITGSYGKTTTKNFLRDILNGRYKTYATPRSYNTLMGVCLAINNDMADDYSIEYFISEMGAYVEGEIARIAELTPPDISIVVEVGPQHLERFGSIENVATAKYEIIKALSPQGLGVFNWDNPYVRKMYERGYPDNRIAVSKEFPLDAPSEDGPRFVASEIEETLNGLSFLVTDRQENTQERIDTPVIGIHNVTNLLLVIAVAVHEGMSLRDIVFRARMLQPAESRLVREVTASGITIINDAYSANPVGVLSSLKVLGMHQSGKRLLITPGMVELGELQDSENYKLGEAAAQYATDIILVGERQTEAIKQGILSTDFPEDHLQTVEALSEAVAWYQSTLSSGDTVLFLNDLPDTY